MNYLILCKHISIFILVNHHITVNSIDDNGEKIENVTNSESSCLENSDDNIFDTIFNLGSKNDWLELLDDNDVEINTRHLDNFTITSTNFEQIIYYDISATPLNKFNDEYQFEYNNFGDYAETKIIYVSNVIKIDGLIQVKHFNASNVTIDSFGSFTILFRCPKFVRTTRQTDTCYGIEQTKPYLKIEIENLQDNSSVTHSLESNFEKMQFALFPQLLPQLVTRKFRQFENLFPFLSDCFSTRLNSTYSVNNSIIMQMKEYYYSLDELGPIVIQGLENVTNIRITIYKKNLYATILTPIMFWYRIIVTTGPVNIQYQWGDKKNEIIPNVNSLTLALRPTDEPVYFEYDYQSHIGKVTDQNYGSFDYNCYVAVKFNCNDSDSYFWNPNLPTKILRALEYYLLKSLESEYQLIENPFKISP